MACIMAIFHALLIVAAIVCRHEGWHEFGVLL